MGLDAASRKREDLVDKVIASLSVGTPRNAAGLPYSNKCERLFLTIVCDTDGVEPFPLYSRKLDRRNELYHTTLWQDERIRE